MKPTERLLSRAVLVEISWHWSDCSVVFWAGLTPWSHICSFIHECKQEAFGLIPEVYVLYLQLVWASWGQG